MRSALMTDLFLGFMLQFFKERKNTTVAAYISKVIVLKQAGGNVDVHLQAVADYLLGGNKPNFADLTRRINDEADELLGRGSDPE